MSNVCDRLTKIGSLKTGKEFSGCFFVCGIRRLAILVFRLPFGNRVGDGFLLTGKAA